MALTPSRLRQFAHFESFKSPLREKLCSHFAKAAAELGDIGRREDARHDLAPMAGRAQHRALPENGKTPKPAASKTQDGPWPRIIP